MTNKNKSEKNIEINMDNYAYLFYNNKAFESKYKISKEELLKKYNARVVRMDQDTTSKKGSLQKITEAIMFNPVHNMKIIDAGITAERLGCSRNKTEFVEHAIKEGSFLFFLYGMGGMIENGINKFSSKYLNKPIDLAIDVFMDDKFAKALADFAEIYVNDAFGTAHRAHASTAGVADYLPAVCGYLIQKEISVMGKALSDPARPFVAILGGAKVSDKIGVINNLLDKVDTLIIGGGMAYTFFRAAGHSVGTSLCEEDKLDLANEMVAKAAAKGVNFMIPVDNVVATEYDENAEHKIVNSDDIPDGWMGLDIGPKTRELFANAIKGAGTVVWNGPMGVSEWANFAAGTEAVAAAVADSGAISIIGGGDSAAAVEKLGFASRMTHISTGGGASLEFLEGKDLPGISCLLNK